MNNLVLHGPCGSITILELRDFLYKIPVEETNCATDRIIIPKLNSSISSQVFDLNAPIEYPTISSEEHKTKELFLLDINDLLKSISQDDFLDYIRSYLVKSMYEEFKILIAKKKPDFYLKELKIDTLNQASRDAARKSADNLDYGFQISLSKYSHFFVMANPDDFKIYYMKFERRGIHSDRIEFRGAFVSLKNNWKLIRAEDCNAYLKELASQRSIYENPYQLEAMYQKNSMNQVIYPQIESGYIRDNQVTNNKLKKR